MKQLFLGVVIGLSLTGAVAFAKEYKKTQVDASVIVGDQLPVSNIKKFTDGNIKKFTDGNIVCYMLQGSNGVGISCLKKY